MGEEDALLHSVTRQRWARGGMRNREWYGRRTRCKRCGKPVWLESHRKTGEMHAYEIWDSVDIDYGQDRLRSDQPTPPRARTMQGNGRGGHPLLFFVRRTIYGG
jgi:hypothetical protein